MTWGDIRLSLASAFPDADIPLIDSWISMAYTAILERTRWSGLKGELSFAARGAIRDGSVSVTSGSTNVVGSGTSWLPEQTGWKIKIGPSNTTYIVTVEDGTHLTLDREYVGKTESGLDYVLFQNVFPLPAHVKYVKDVRVADTGRLLTRAGSVIQSRYGGPVIVGNPSHWWHGPDLLDELMQNVRSIVLYPAPDRDLTIQVHYDGAATAYRGDNLDESPPSWIPGELILAQAKVYGYSRAGNSAAAATCRQTADEIMAGLIRHESFRGGPSRITVDPAISSRRSRIYR